MSEFITKDSGERAQFSTGMVRDTQVGKPRFDLLFPVGIPYGDQILTRFAGLMERGARKYTERNWELAHTVEEMERAKGSALRHLIQWYCGETDEDHAAAVMFNLMSAETIRLKMEAEVSVDLANNLASKAEHEDTLSHEAPEDCFCPPDCGACRDAEVKFTGFPDAVEEDELTPCCADGGATCQHDPIEASIRTWTNCCGKFSEDGMLSCTQPADHPGRHLADGVPY